MTDRSGGRLPVRLSTALGVVLGILGLAALAVPDLTTGLPANDILVAGLGALLVLGGIREVQRRRTTERVYAETPAIEQAVELPTPGDEFDRRLDGLSALLYRASERRRLREEVGDVAVETLRRRFGYTEREARAALADGTWTGDPFAAAFLNDEVPEITRVQRLRELLGPESAFHHRARRAVDELYRLAEGDEGGGDAGD